MLSSQDIQSLHVVASALSFLEVKCEKPKVLCYSFNLSDTVFRTPVSPFSRKMLLFFSCVTNIISDNYFIFLIIFIFIWVF